MEWPAPSPGWPLEAIGDDRPRGMTVLDRTPLTGLLGIPPLGSRAVLEVRTLTDGGQRAEDVARELAAFLSAATRSLDIAIYDLSLSPPVAAILAEAFAAARSRGLAMRLVFNRDHRGPIPVPPPPEPDLEFIASCGADVRAIAGIPDLMHHKYVIRDGESVWTGSTNWRDDAWTREENVILVVASAALGRAYVTDFEQLWMTGDVARSGRVDPVPVLVDQIRVRPWFTPGRARSMVHRIAQAIGHARGRVRIGSPVLTSGPILATLAELAADGRVDLAGALDATQMGEVLGQWRSQGHSRWKIHLVRAVLERAPFSGKRSTPYAPGSVHDYMHAKILVADDTVFLGSYNLSHSGELNAENVLEIEDAALASRLAAYLDGVRSRYPRLVL